MQDNRLPKQLFKGELTESHRPRGRPKLRYRDILKKTLNVTLIKDNGKPWPQAGVGGGKLFA